MPQLSNIITNFSNGISQNAKNWLPYSGRFMRNLELFTDSDAAVLAWQPVKDSGLVVTDLVKWIVDANPYENARYALGDSGNIYKIASNVWTLDHTISGGSPAGQGLIMYANGLYYANGTTIGRKYPLSGSATYTDDFFSDGVQNIDASVTANGFSYTPPTTIQETTGDKITYQPAFDPLVAVQLYVISPGSGNWTVTLHDSNNVSLGTVTNLNANVGTGFNTFTFATPVRINIGAIYHIHVTSTVADGKVQSGANNDLSSAQYKTNFGILLADTDYHPILMHTNGVTGTFVIGNEHYFGTYDGVTYNPNKITLEPGFKVRTFTKINENAVGFCWKGSSVDAYEYGKAYVWDGIQPYYNYGRDLTQGTPNAVMNYKNRLFGIFGSEGNLEMAPDESQPFRKLQGAPKLTAGSRVEVLPGAIGIWRTRSFFGYSNTNDANAGVYVSGQTPPTGIEQGIYEFGNQSDRAISYTDVSTEVLNFAFQPSTPIANPLSFKIGCIMPFGKDCYFSYKDGSNYYVDRVTKGNNPASTGSWESLIDDKTIDKINGLNQQPGKFKRALKIKVTFTALPSGGTVTAKYRLERAAAWTFGSPATQGATEAAVVIGSGGGNYKEIEFGFDVTAITISPTITSCGCFYEPLSEESASASL